jgi:8-oxo-dGTP pyrophosphatase MutT (NUDIX family)
MTLAAQLDAFQPHDAKERADRERMLALLDSPAPFDRQQFEPGHFTASAFVVHDDYLLLIWHTKLHRWLQPGGHIDASDASPHAAARRELAEEANVADAVGDGQLFDLDIHPIPPNPKRGEPGHEHFDLRFLFHVASDTVAAGSDAGAAKWLPLDQVTADATDASVTRAVVKLRAVG